MRRIGVAWTGFQFELFVAIMCTLIGLPLAAGIAPQPNSVVAVFPSFAVIVWGLSLTLGGASVVYGILWRHFRPVRFISGLLMERAGLYMLASSISCFIIAAIVFAGLPSIFMALLVGAFVAACVSRIRSINKEISIIREHGGNV